MFSKSVIMIALSFSVLSNASATDKKFSCSNVGGTAEWTVYVDLNKEIAGFFDNDETVVVPLISMGQLESLPPQTVYTFEGQDTAGAKGDKIRIWFNETKKKASVVFLSKKKTSSMDAEDGCVADSSIDL